MHLDRRHFLAVAGVALLAGCAPRTPVPTGSPSASPTPTPTTVAPDWDALQRTLGDRLLRPGASGFAAAVPTRIPLFDSAAPTAIVRAATEDDVVTAVRFAAASDVPVTVRAGGHNYAGWSSGGGGHTDLPAAFVIDVAALNSVTVSGDTVRVGAGALLGDVYAALAQAGRAIGAGSCGTVAVGGLISGGGQGVLARSFGLAADQVGELRIVTGDGVAHAATASTEPDLFWAARGGGGGLFGVTTEFTLTTRVAPTVTMLFFRWASDQARDLFQVWQDWAPGADSRLWTSLKILGGSDHPDGLSVTMSGTWTGPAAELDGALEGLLRGVPAPASRSAVPRGYGDAMARYAGEPIRESFVATSVVGTRPLSRTEAGSLIAAIQTAVATPGITEGGLALDALGGAIAEVSAAATPFPHRQSAFVGQATANFADGADPAPFHAALAPLRTFGVSAWGSGAYVNYPDAAITDPAEAYFGTNAARLREITKRYDPRGIFPAYQLG